MIKQGAHQLPAVVVHLRQLLHKLTQSTQVRISIHRDFMKAHQIAQRMLAQRLLRRSLSELLAQIIERSESLMQTNPAKKEISIPAIMEIEQLQPFHQG